jgi:hypothetical protein
MLRWNPPKLIAGWDGTLTQMESATRIRIRIKFTDCLLILQ